MKRFKKTLSAFSKSRRHRRNLLNIMVTVLAWLVEMFGFLLVLIGTHILGHQNHFVNLLLQTLTNLFYFVLVPSFLLINDTDMKGRFAESDWYDKFLSKINCQYIEHDKDKKEDEESIAEANSTIEARVETHQYIKDKIPIENLANKESDPVDIDPHPVCFKRSKNQIKHTDKHKLKDGTHHGTHGTNSASNDCVLIDLEAVNKNSS